MMTRGTPIYGNLHVIVCGHEVKTHCAGFAPDPSPAGPKKTPLADASRLVVQMDHRNGRYWNDCTMNDPVIIEYSNLFQEDIGWLSSGRRLHNKKEHHHV